MFGREGCPFPHAHSVARSHPYCGVPPRKHPGLNLASGQRRGFGSAANHRDGGIAWCWFPPPWTPASILRKTLFFRTPPWWVEAIRGAPNSKRFPHPKVVIAAEKNGRIDGLPL